jgi:hypothetical protein
VQFSLGWQTTCDLDAHAYLFDDYYQKIDHVYKGDLQVGLPTALSNKAIGSARAPPRVCHVVRSTVNARWCLFCLAKLLTSTTPQPGTAWCSLVRPHLSLVQPHSLWPNLLGLCWSSHPFNIHNLACSTTSTIVIASEP